MNSLDVSKVAITVAFLCTVCPAQTFYCHKNGEVWPTLVGGRSMYVYSGTTSATYRFAVQPALGTDTHFVVTADGKDVVIPSVPLSVEVNGAQIVLTNGSGRSGEACFVGERLHSITGKRGGLYCEDNPSAIPFSIPAGGHRDLYVGSESATLRITNQPAAGYNNGMSYRSFVGNRSILIPPSPAAVDIEGTKITISNESSVARQGCYVSDARSQTSLPLRTQSTRGFRDEGPFTATADANGQPHPYSAAIRASGKIRCSFASQNPIPMPNPPPPPANCYVATTGGGSMALAVGQIMGTGPGGTMTLTCSGVGALRCQVTIHY